MYENILVANAFSFIGYGEWELFCLLTNFTTCLCLSPIVLNMHVPWSDWDLNLGPSCFAAIHSQRYSDKVFKVRN